MVLYGSDQVVLERLACVVNKSANSMPLTACKLFLEITDQILTLGGNVFCDNLRAIFKETTANPNWMPWHSYPMYVYTYIHLQRVMLVNYLEINLNKY